MELLVRACRAVLGVLHVTVWLGGREAAGGVEAEGSLGERHPDLAHYRQLQKIVIRFVKKTRLFCSHF